MTYKNIILLLDRLNIDYHIYADRIERLKWGTEYYSYQNPDNEIIFYFPESPIKIHQVLLRPGRDVFPVKWTLSISNDNESYVPIIENGTKPCHDSEIQLFQKKSQSCKKYDPLSFDTVIESTFSYYIKFKLIENSYYEAPESRFKNLICINGIDFVGEFLSEFNFASHFKDSNSQIFLLVTSLFIIK